MSFSNPRFALPAAVLAGIAALAILLGLGAAAPFSTGKAPGASGGSDPDSAAGGVAPASGSTIAVSFRPPLDIPLTLTGTFGELRHNHFHSGIDITTQAREGLLILSCADGFVSRVKVSPWGFGKALYVTHPNGLTTVYAHLREFEGPVAALVDSLHFTLQANRLDEVIPPGRLQVSAGQVIARSGNTGSSAGPHLHFEVRRGDTPLNPLNYGFKVTDAIAPEFRSLYFYPIWEGYPIDDARAVALTRSGSRWRTQDSVVRVPAGRVGLAVLADDRANGRSNRNGIYRLNTEIEGQSAFSFILDSFRFDETRYINAHIDYAHEATKRQRIHRCFRLPGDRSSLYRKGSGDGTILLEEGERRDVTVEIEDRAGNRSELRLRLLAVASENPPAVAYRQLLNWDEDNFVYADDLILGFPAGSLYEDLYLRYETEADPDGLSDRHHIHKSTTPIHEAFEISIQPERLPARNRNRALIVRETKRGRWASIGGRWEDGFVKARSRELGTFYVAIDSTGPYLRSLTISEGGGVRNSRSLRFKATDNLAGLAQWSATVDGVWALIDFDAKRNLMSVELPEGLAPGPHLLVLKATDAVDNLTALELTFKKLP